MDHFAPLPPAFDLDATMTMLRSGSSPILNASNQWTEFLTAPKDQNSEDGAFRPILEIFRRVVEAIIANSDRTKDDRSVDFLQNPTRVPISAERHNLSRPDGYLVLKDRNEKESLRWADIVLSCEYKRKEGIDDLDDVRIHQGHRRSVLGSPLTLGRAKMLVEFATRHARRSAPSSYIWYDHREYYDKNLVLLPLLGCGQRAVRFYGCTFVYLFKSV
jgi:hypothetical protein